MTDHGQCLAAEPTENVLRTFLSDVVSQCDAASTPLLSPQQRLHLSDVSIYFDRNDLRLVTTDQTLFLTDRPNVDLWMYI